MLTYMVFMDGGGMLEGGAVLMGTGTKDGGGFLNKDPTLAKNDLAVAGEGVVVSVKERSLISSRRESSSSLVTVVTLTPGWRLVGIMVGVVARNRKM